MKATKTAFLVLILAVAISFAGCINGGGNANQTQQDSTTNASENGSAVSGNISNQPSKNQTEETTTNESMDKQPSIYNTGKNFTAGNVRYNITQVRTMKSVGNGSTREAADGEFVVVTVLMKNIVDSTQTVQSQDFTVVDESGNQYRASTGAMIALRHQPLLTINLEPTDKNVWNRAVAAYDVPVNSTGLRLKITPPSDPKNITYVKLQR